MKKTWLSLVGCLLLGTALAAPPEFTFQTLDFPGANAVAGGTMAEGVFGTNVVGTYFDTNAHAHGFLYNGNTYITLDDPVSVVTNGGGSNTYYGTDASGIGANGIVGWYTAPDTTVHGFLFSNGNFTTIDEPNSYQYTIASGISGSNIVGTFNDAGSVTHGFLLDGTNYTTLDDPIALNAFFGGATFANGIDGSNIVGIYSNPENHGFLFDGTNYTTLDFPNAGGYSVAYGVSGTNIVGYYFDSGGHAHGYLYTAGAYTSFDVPGAVQTFATGVWSNTMAGYYVDSNSVTHGFVAVPTSSILPPSTGSLKVTITPSGVVAAGAQWQVDGGTLLNSGTVVTNLTNGIHVVSFGPASGWTPPADQSVTITQGETNVIVGLYTPSMPPADGLILLTNGSGTIQHGAWPQTLVVGTKYTVKAIPDAGNLFENWIGGSGSNYVVLSTSASYTFTMQTGLLLEANFLPDAFPAAHGAYHGLFAPANSDRGQTNSGAVDFILTLAGTFSGNLRMGFQTVPLAGKFAPDGSATIASKRRNQSPLITTLQLNAAGQSVTGTVSDGSFLADLIGYQSVFSSRNKTTNFAGRFSVIIPGTNNPAVGPYGTGFGTVLVQPTGTISFTGSLADGTPVSQTSFISQGGYWPMYLSLYGGKGSFWSWNFLSNGVITSPISASWINPTNTSKTAGYRSGFTNQNVTLTGGLYDPANEPLLLLVNGTVTVRGGNLPGPITNNVANSLTDQILFSGGSNNFSIAINAVTGLISGSFHNPPDSLTPIKIFGVLGPGQGNGAGYFPGANQSGLFTLVPQ